MGRLEKKAHYDKMRKEFWKMWLESKDVERQMRNLPYVELDTPYFSHYSIGVKLREDVARSKEAEILLPLIEKYIKPFQTRKLKKGFRQESVFIRRYGDISQLYPTAVTVNEKEYSGFTLTEKSYFRPYKRYYGGYVLDIPIWKLKYKVEKVFLKHVREHSPELIAKDSYFTRHIWSEEGKYHITCNNERHIKCSYNGWYNKVYLPKSNRRAWKQAISEAAKFDDFDEALNVFTYRSKRHE